MDEGVGGGAGDLADRSLPRRRPLARAARRRPRGAAKATFGVRLTDAAGHRLTLADVSVTGLPADRQAFSGKSWAQDVRLPLRAGAVKASALSLARITRVEVIPRSTKGQLFVLDAWGRQPGLSTAAPLRLSRIDVGTATVEEGATQHTVRLPVTVTGPAHTAGRVWVVVIDPEFGTPVGHLVDVPAGASRFTVDIPVPGDSHDDWDVLLYQVSVKAVRGLAVGDYTGGLTVLDDDPTPTLTVVPVATSVEEGSDLVWTLRLSDVTDVGVFVALTPTAPGPGLPPELDTKDVPADWLTEHEVDPSGSRRVLSEAAPFIFGFIEPGTDSIDVVRADAHRPPGRGRGIGGADRHRGRRSGAARPAPRLVGTVTDPA